MPEEQVNNLSGITSGIFYIYRVKGDFHLVDFCLLCEITS